jgi:hypothetical protein
MATTRAEAVARAEAMVRANALLEAEPLDREALRRELAGFEWGACLWATAATRELTVRSVLNEMHLLFLLLARARAALAPAPPGARLRGLLASPQAELVPAPVAALSLRALLDAVQNLQAQWGALVGAEDPGALHAALDACMARFGALATGRHAAGVLDAEDLVEVARDGRRALSAAAVRRFAAFFFVAYRHAHLAGAAIELDAAEPLALDVHSHLLAASLDDFYRCSMYWDMLPASVLQYRHEFTGMFHSMSQVMYYNNPTYARRRQAAADAIAAETPPEHVLPIMMQVHPEVRVLHEDDALPDGFAPPGALPEWDPAAPLPAAPRDWAWLFLPGRLYLCTRAGHLFWAARAAPLCNLLGRALG